ncbi:MAG: helix-turn-helix domain-containing protein [Mycobacterium sp.]
MAALARPRRPRVASRLGGHAPILSDRPKQQTADMSPRAGFDAQPLAIRTASPDKTSDVSEAAAALRISRSSIYRPFDAGELAWVQIGASRRVTSTEIHRFIAAHTEAAS